LFGIGNPGGAIDIVTNKADLNRNSYKLELRGDTFDSVRSVIDANMVLIPKKFGVRLDLLHDDRGRNIKPSQDKRDSAFIASTVQLTKFTTVNLNAETTQIRQQLPRPFETFDWYNTWVAAARRCCDDCDHWHARGREWVGVPGHQWLPGLYSGRRGWIGRALRSGRAARQRRPRRPGQFRRRFGEQAGAARHLRHGRRRSRSPEHAEFFRRRPTAPGRGAQLGNRGKHEYSYRENAESQGTGADNAVKVDANRLLPNGQPNPNVGLPYVELTGNVTKIPTNDEQLRATLAYEKDFSDLKIFDRGLGKFTIAACTTTSRTTNTSIIFAW